MSHRMPPPTRRQPERTNRRIPLMVIGLGIAALTAVGLIVFAGLNLNQLLEWGLSAPAKLQRWFIGQPLTRQVITGVGAALIALAILSGSRWPRIVKIQKTENSVPLWTNMSGTTMKSQTNPGISWSSLMIDQRRYNWRLTLGLIIAALVLSGIATYVAALPAVTSRLPLTWTTMADYDTYNCKPGGVIRATGQIDTPRTLAPTDVVRVHRDKSFGFVRGREYKLGAYNETEALWWDCSAAAKQWAQNPLPATEVATAPVTETAPTAPATTAPPTIEPTAAETTTAAEQPTAGSVLCVETDVGYRAEGLGGGTLQVFACAGASDTFSTVWTTRSGVSYRAVGPAGQTAGFVGSESFSVTIRRAQAGESADFTWQDARYMVIQK